MIVTIHPNSSIIAKAMGRQGKSASLLRFASFVLDYPCDEGLLLSNGLTGEVVLARGSLSGRDGLQSLLNGADAEELYGRWFLVPEEFDECAYVEDLRTVLALMTQKSTLRTFTILTTMDCNARCPYCYERGLPRMPMTRDVAERVGRFIVERSMGEKVKLRWFGGEPLLGKEAIDTICAVIDENSVDFSSSIITNGSLFDSALVERAVSEWHVKRVQITLDGMRETYNKMKGFVDDSGDAFERVLGNIGLLVAASVHVTIRLNVGPHNVDELLELVGYLAKRFEGCEKLSVYAHPLFQYVATDSEDHVDREAWQCAERLQNAIASYGMSAVPRVPKLRVSHCMADSGRAVVINPEGGLSQCEHVAMTDVWGSLDDSAIDDETRRRWSERVTGCSECATCPLYPSCARLRLCDAIGKNCTPGYRKYKLSKYEQGVLSAYETWKTDGAKADSADPDCVLDACEHDDW